MALGHDFVTGLAGHYQRGLKDMKLKKFLAVLPILAIGLTGCGNMETQADEVGIRYSGGAIFPEAIEFKRCVDPSKQEFGDPGDNTYIYPNGQRTFRFTGEQGADSGPLDTSAPSPGGGQPIVLTVKGIVTFTPNFANCDELRKFHERIGLKFKAYEPEGWSSMLSTYFKQATDRAIDSQALKYDWVKLSSDGATKDAWERDVIAEIPKILAEQTGGEFFHIDSVLLQRPDLPGDVAASIAKTEAARQEAQTAEQVKKAAESFPGGVNAYMEYQRAQATNDAIRSGNVKVIPVPSGSPIIVNPGQ